MSSSAARRSNETKRPSRPPRPGRPSAPEQSGDGAWEWVKSIAIAVVLFLVIRTFFLQAFSIPSGSMEGTLRIGDYLMANNAVFGAPIPFTNLRTPTFRDPEHGDVVVFRPTYNDPVIDVVKRVIGEPGDTLQMIDRVVYRNGEALVEPYVEPNYTPDAPMQLSGWSGYRWHLDALPATVDRSTYHPTRDNWGPLIVPDGHYFMMGDNRDESLDSRFMGFIPREVIRGKPMFVYFSVDPDVERPFPRLLTAARWDRIGTVLD